MAKEIKSLLACVNTWRYPGGEVRLAATEKGLTEFTPASAVLQRQYWEGPERYVSPGLCGYGIFEADNWLETAMEQLDEYLHGERTFFVVPFDYGGTDFQREVLSALMRIPYGETVTYAQLAAEIGRPTALRAVAAACGKNPLPIFIPCHRVVGKYDLGGYSDPAGTEIKEYLLRLEGALPAK